MSKTETSEAAVVVEGDEPTPMLHYLIFGATVLFAVYIAYDIRLYAIKHIWKGIHEFDPWFNYRATRYLARHGYEAFFKWFDHRSWYPLGRPVGTTIYPGLQIVAVSIWKVLNKVVGYPMTLEDVCVYFPAWFGAIATVFLGLLTWECSGSIWAACISLLVMAIVPAHMMRSIGGGFDNESLALTMMCSTFYFWVRSLRNEKSWPIGIIAAVFYIGMGAAWGGYVFVVNMIGVHATALIFMGRYSAKLHKAYSLWYIIGTVGVTFIPVIGLTPIKSLEQMGPAAIFVLLQVLTYWDYECKRRGLKEKDKQERIYLLIRIFFACGAVGVVILGYLISIEFFGPLSVRVRSLFIKHSLTGNPLVDSVAEHQPTSPQMYAHYLGPTLYLGLIGFFLCFFTHRTDAQFLLVVYAIVAYYFSQKMNRLIILAGPIVSALTGVTVGAAWKWVASQPKDLIFGSKKPKTKENKKKKTAAKKSSPWILLKEGLSDAYDTPTGIIIRIVACLFIVFATAQVGARFYATSAMFAQHVSNPQIVYKARLNDGREVIVDDYLKSYEWLRDNTPKDSRILSWWDYGYQIAGVSRRITLADGNTWNLEHIALIGKILTSPQKKAHDIAKHLADYVLVWSGGGGDDLGKSPHIARIASSVYNICGPRDPLCRGFGFSRGQDGKRVPSRSMRNSLLYNLVAQGKEADAQVDGKLFREVHRSKYGLVRIYKVLDIDEESKAWTLDPANRVCDAPGSWYCPGRYPPAVTPPPSHHKPIDWSQHSSGHGRGQ